MKKVLRNARRSSSQPQGRSDAAKSASSLRARRSSAGVKNGRSVSAQDMIGTQEVGAFGRRSHSPAKRRPMRR